MKRQENTKVIICVTEEDFDSKDSWLSASIEDPSEPEEFNFGPLSRLVGKFEIEIEYGQNYKTLMSIDELHDLLEPLFSMFFIEGFKKGLESDKRYKKR